MAVEVILPRVDMDMAEGKIAAWYVKNGDAVKKGQTLFDIETDKAAMEVDAEADGIIQGISGELNVPIPVGQPVAWLLAEGEALPAAAGAPAVRAAAEPNDAPEAAAATAEPVAAPPAPAAVEATPLLRATPLARSLAREHGIDLQALAGSGPDGRIVARDVAPARPSTVSAGAALHLAWLSRGTGAPFVLLHGFASEHGSWKPVSARLADAPVAGIDLPNHGQSGPAAVGGYADLAAKVLERLDGEGIGDCHLAGHSLGAGVALALADRLGARLRSLTLLAPAGLGPDIHGEFIAGVCRATGEASLRAWLRELVHDERWINDAFVATAWRQLRAPGRQAAWTAMAEAMLPDGTQAESLRAALDAVRVPTKVIWGRADRIIPARHAQRLPGRVALHLLEGIGHVPQIEAAALVAELLLEQRRAAAQEPSASKAAAAPG